MGRIIMQHHQISPNPLRKAAFPGSFALNRDTLLLRAPRQGFPLRSSSLTIRSEGNGTPSARTVKRHSKEELVAFFRSIQTAIAKDSPKASKRARKPSPADPFEEAARRKQSYEELDQDGQPNLLNLEDMKLAELRELARARRMRGYSKLKKGELIDRLKGGLV